MSSFLKSLCQPHHHYLLSGEYLAVVTWQGFIKLIQFLQISVSKALFVSGTVTA
jgi:hypothetical protein